jgi:aminoglycoside/choline kinase family phosphotransferase
VSSGEPEAGPAEVWRELQSTPGVGEIALPWPVAGARRLGEHASLRRFYRLSPDPAHTGEPRTAVLVLYEDEDEEALRRYERTAHWFLGAGVHVPRVYALSARALLVEDGGDALLADAPADRDLETRYVEAARIILALQSHGLVEPHPNPSWSLDETRLRRELEFTEQHALRGWLEADPSPERERAFDLLAEEVGGQPSRVCHRDFHARNLLVGERLMVVDFQDVMAGPLFYDLASLLHDDYRDVPPTVSAAALETFWTAAAMPVPVSGEAAIPHQPAVLPRGARQGYALTAAQRSLKALGTFGYQVSVAGRHEYARYARRTWGHARRTLAALGWHELIEELAVFNRL